MSSVPTTSISISRQHREVLEQVKRRCKHGTVQNTAEVAIEHYAQHVGVPVPNTDPEPTPAPSRT